MCVEDNFVKFDNQMIVILSLHCVHILRFTIDQNVYVDLKNVLFVAWKRLKYLSIITTSKEVSHKKSGNCLKVLTEFFMPK